MAASSQKLIAASLTPFTSATKEPWDYLLNRRGRRSFCLSRTTFIFAFLHCVLEWSGGPDLFVGRPLFSNHFLYLGSLWNPPFVPLGPCARAWGGGAKLIKVVHRASISILRYWTCELITQCVYNCILQGRCRDAAGAPKGPEGGVLGSRRGFLSDYYWLTIINQPTGPKCCNVCTKETNVWENPNRWWILSLLSCVSKCVCCVLLGVWE